MAQFDSHASARHSRSNKKIRKPIRIDMTAMVDVGFLLLTFFVLTTSLSDSSALELHHPKTPWDKQKADEAKFLTLVPDSSHQLAYYTGFSQPQTGNTHYGSTGLRRLIHQHLNAYPNRCDQGLTSSNCWEPIILIKPRSSTNYRQIINLLDELSLTGAPHYAFAEFTRQDSLILAGD